MKSSGLFFMLIQQARQLSDEVSANAEFAGEHTVRSKTPARALLGGRSILVRC